ncbi:hypothetical protein SDC9_183968 [bioreactor metagenome]|uniref:Uncharacterized protein n=1 Tax=bioreactor metagenome TaxID=1076179 RepID=A0A645HE99_9ZZZZ
MGHSADGGTVDEGFAAFPAQQAHHAAEQSGFAHAVGSKNRQHFPAVHRKGNITQDRGIAITKGALSDGEIHSFAPPVLRSSKMKKGAPIKAVSMETGISAAVAARAAVSITTIKEEPRPTLTGMIRRLSLP